MVEEMRERLAAEGDAKAVAGGEIRERLQARRMFLAKD